MQKAVPIRVKRETRARLHAVKYPGQTLDGIITQMIDLWEREKIPRPTSSKRTSQN